ncbi:G2/mitotic-specific cyclin-B-like [Tropilaelaps mercedesae]|uniref:G2/mitotic-specific cyclin-B-like n=1 Tax=Tropilaelaps mercedesae TaxID=418985 RepID=A0A1V9XSJ8_9ACAR|nr:G2/mitotic-specific cyclin-B-like [Tropilaelaps mercedesae]
MALQQRSQLNVNRENQQVSNAKNLVKNVSAAPRAALSARNTNIAAPLAGVKSKLKIPPAPPMAAVQEVQPSKVQPVPIGCLPIEPTILPPNVVDIDEEDVDHLEFSAEYVKDIYEYLFRLESQYAAKPQYLSKHCALRPHMRMILIEWLVSLQGRYKLLQETLLMTVSVLDRFMSETSYEVSRRKFQLVGVACMLVACKYEEMYLPSVADFAYMCDGAYTTRDILWMERMILDTLHFELGKPLSAHFLRRFSKAGGADSTTHTIAKYLLELALYEYSLVHCKPSVIAAAALSIAGAVTEVVEWDETMLAYSRYQMSDLSFVAGKLADMAASADTNKYIKATYKKYAADRFQRVAKTVGQSSVVLNMARKHTESGQ